MGTSATRVARLGTLYSARGVLLAGLGLGCGLSVFLFGYYDLAVFGVLALVVLPALLALVISRPFRPSPAALIAGSGLMGLWLWALASTLWAQSAERALIEADRWLLYAAVFAVLVLLMRDRRLAGVAIAAATAGIVALVVYLTGTLLIGDAPQSLFIPRQLSEPFQYTNGLAAYLLLGFWPLVAVAERDRPVVLSAAAAGLATLVLCLLVLVQSRGAAAALLASAILILAVVPGRLTRAWLLLIVFGGAALAMPTLLDVYSSSQGSRPTLESVRRAGSAALAVAGGAAAVWLVIGLARAWIARRGEGGNRTGRRLAETVLAVVVAFLLAVSVGLSGRIVDQGKTQYDAFVSLGAAGGSSRLVSGAGNRYDYWRIALREAGAYPVAGIGAGNYHFRYFRERRTAEDIRQPHSVELQMLAELGLVGGFLLAIFVFGVLLGWVRTARAGRTDPGARTLALAGGGAFLGWLAHTSVDWHHLVPGLTGIALCAAAGLVMPPPGAGGAAGTDRPAGRLVIGLVVAAVVAGGLFVARPVLGEHHRSEAQGQLASEPSQALREADRALSYDGQSLAAYHVKAAAQARLDRYTDARATLLEAIRVEPDDFVTWALLGDLATRAGDVAQADQAYGRASELNPRDPLLAELADEPQVPGGKAPGQP